MHVLYRVCSRHNISKLGPSLAADQARGLSGIPPPTAAATATQRPLQSSCSTASAARIGIAAYSAPAPALS